MAKDLYGIIGHPVQHSLSPAMHNAAFEALGIDAEYQLFDIEPDNLEAFLGDMPHKKIRGVNITIPHKIKARSYLERHGALDENARRLGAVNTIKLDRDLLRGFNTDGPGFYRSLVEELKFEPEGKNIFVLGAGGAASAAIMYLGNGPKKIYVYEIDDTKARELERHYGKYYDKKRLIIVSAADMKRSLNDTNLLVNATPVGMKESDPSPMDKSLLHTGLYVYDLVYNRPATTLVKEANAMKCRAITGLGMLLYQGAIAFEIWTGVKAPVEVMRRALKNALKNIGG